MKRKIYLAGHKGLAGSALLKELRSNKNYKVYFKTRKELNLFKGGLFLAAGKVADLRDKLHELPLAGEADAFDEQLRFGLIAEESPQTREIAFRADIASAGFSERTGDALAGRRLQGGVVDERLIEQGGFVGRAGLADEFDPGTRADGVDFATHEEALHVGRGDAGVDRLHDGIQRGFLAINLRRLSGDVFEPRAGEFVDARPGGEIKEGVLGILREMREHGAGAFRRADAGEGTVGL
jgi:hypothetical protein